jgi:hypothetical protein
MSMITLNGSLLNVFKAPVRKSAEQGEKEKDKIQILGDVALPNGQLRKDLMTITVKDARKYQDLQGSEVAVSVGAFSPDKGTVIFFEVSA